jgi:hypothetical protein
MYNITEASNILRIYFLSKVFTTSMTTNLCKYHVVSDGGKMAGKCAFVTIVYKAWFLSFRMAVNAL